MTDNVLNIIKRFAKAGDGSADFTDEQKGILDNQSPGDSSELREWLRSASQYLSNCDESVGTAPASHSLSVVVPEGIVCQMMGYQSSEQTVVQRVHPTEDDACDS